MTDRAPFIADFHIHSHYSRATTPQLTPENLDYWSRLKGLQVMGTGDCVHPRWLDELRAKLEPAGGGLYRLKPDHQLPAVSTTRLVDESLRFLLTTEISSIYKKNGRVRKVHNICVLPDFDAAARFQARLRQIGNIASDGRPILGLDAKHLLEILLEVAPTAYLIPAHIWTPWFSVLGSQSGFDSLEECFEELTEHIFAVETGLSSDPPMNRACTRLDRFRLVSNSDAHSPEKIGREANLFDTVLSYEGIYNALKHDRGFVGTIEFFPEEGKYHYDGHRNCGVRWDPLETLRHQGRCSGCQKPVTKGVLYRVAQLADRSDPGAFASAQRHYSITPLPEVLAEALGQKGTATQKVRREYLRLIERLGSEFHILLFAGLDEIARVGGERLAEGIRRLRSGEVSVEAGYDGEFGTVRVFRGESGDAELFQVDGLAATGARPSSIEFDIAEFQQRLRSSTTADAPAAAPSAAPVDEQRAAIEFGVGVCLVIAGPGAGKTRILTERIARLIQAGAVPPEQILAITFSNQAAGEIRDRVARLVPAQSARVTVATFHAFGLSVLHEQAGRLDRTSEFQIVDPDERAAIIRALTGDRRRAAALQREIEDAKQGRRSDDAAPDTLSTTAAQYEQALRQRNAFDLDDLIWRPVQLFRDHRALAGAWRRRIRWILVDEYQDINARQYELLRLLGGDGQPNLFAIGDPDQAIYGFRGSDVRFIEQLRRDYSGATVIRLRQSFRCPTVVLKGAGQVLHKDAHLLGTRDDVKIHIQQCPNERREAEWVAARIDALMGGIRSLSIQQGVSDGEAQEGVTSFRDIAILCRTSSMFGVFAEALAAHGIAHQIVGAEPFLRQPPWSEAIARWRAARSMLNTDEALRRWLEEPRPIGEVMRHLLGGQDVAREDWDRVDRIAAPFGTRADEFLRALVLRQGIDDLDPRAERVSLMTMHASKGLEFPVVFIPGCEDGLIPFEPFGSDDPDRLAEEERLFYVAMTRTKRYLFLSHAKQRLIRGRWLTQTRSRLLERLERTLLRLEIQCSKPAPDPYRQLSLF